MPYHSVHMKEIGENFNIILWKINYTSQRRVGCVRILK